MSDPTPEMQAVHARMDRRTRARGRVGRFFFRQARAAKADDTKVISAEELEAIYQRAEQKEQP